MKKVTKSIWSKETPLPKTVDAFIKSSPKASQAKLKELRQIIRSVVPKAEETISYRMPMYKVDGKQLIAFAGYQHHIGFYPTSGTLLSGFKKELAQYETAKGTVRFPLERPLPVTLIKKLIKARLKIHKEKIKI